MALSRRWAQIFLFFYKKCPKSLILLTFFLLQALIFICNYVQTVSTTVTAADPLPARSMSAAVSQPFGLKAFSLPSPS